jgi:hypothetical protein
MTIRTSLLCGGVALGVLAAATAPDAAVRPRHKAPARPDVTQQMKDLQAQVASLSDRLSAQDEAQKQTQAQLASAQAEAAKAEAETRAVRAMVDNQIITLPGVVATAVASQPKPPSDHLAYKDLSITLGGFLAAESIYRSRGEAADISSNFNAIPLANNRPGHAEELRFSARQSRLSALVEGSASPTVHLAMYGEFDFQGAAQTANSNESNSYTPRIRHLYGTVDWDNLGLELLAGQAWSLATLNTKGITPRNELPPPTIDGQFLPGFVWTRQPQVRLTKSFDDKRLWVSVSLENPQTTFFTAGTGPGAGVLPASLTFNAPGSTGFNAANSLSLNHVPDVIAKVAYEGRLGVPVHAELFGIYRDFYSRVTGSNRDVAGGGIGAGLVVSAVPDRLDLQLSGLRGQGVGRYGTSQLPDATFAPDGSLQPITETMVLAGATLHATPKLDVYVFAGEERADREASTTAAGAFGYGNPEYVNTGCLSETAVGVCNGNTRDLRQATVGVWDKAYQGGFGRLQVGLQYSYTRRETFPGVGGGPSVGENMLFTSFRYYPF